MTIDPNTVELTTRSGWCGAQQNTCDTLCKDDTIKNNCNDVCSVQHILQLTQKLISHYRIPSTGNVHAPPTARLPVSSITPRPCLLSSVKTSLRNAFRKPIPKREAMNASPRSSPSAPSRTLLRTSPATTTTTIPAPVPPTLLLPRPLRLRRALVAPQRLCPQQLLMPLLPLPWRRQARVPPPLLLSACWPTSSKCFRG
jgi:hypothetical protein